MKIFVLLTIMLCALSASAQQPQTQTAPISSINAKYVNGVAPGYAPTAGSGITLKVGAGTANCSATIVTYVGGTLAMTASATNYVYLDTSSNCAPAVKTTAFSSSDIPLAEVVTSPSAITSISDVRTLFSAPGGPASGVTSINGIAGAFTLTGPGVSCTGSTCTFSGGGGGGGLVFCPPNAQTGATYTLALTDGTSSGAACIGTVTMNNASNNTVTIPPNSSVAFPVPDEIDFIQLGVGQTTLVAGSGVTLITPTSLSTRAQNSTIGIRQLSTNTWIVFGDAQ